MAMEVVKTNPEMSFYPGNEVYQHGTIDHFIGSNVDGVESGFIRCVYTAKDHPGQTVTLLCEKLEGCCTNGCCPKDQWWMTALIVFLVFVLVVFIFGMLLVVICYQRTKSIQRKEENTAATSEAPHLYAGSGYEATPYSRSPAQKGGTTLPAGRSQQIYGTSQTYNTSRF